jgi:CHAT domain-containing protein
VLEADPQDARAWSDLAAAYLVRAGRGQDPRDLLRAYEAANRAVRENGSLPEARFNRALILERLFLKPETRAAWRGYLAVDGGSSWASEAGERLKALLGSPERSAWTGERERLELSSLTGDAKQVATIVERWRQAAREYGEEELLGLWAEAAGQGQTELATRRLRIARTLGEALAKISGDSLVRDAVAAIDDAAGDPGRWQALLQGSRDFREGRKLYGKRDPWAAAKLAAARDALARAGSPLAARAAFFLACDDYVARRYGLSFERLEALAREIAGRPYAGLRAHVLEMQALVAVVQGRMITAIELYEKSLADFQRLGEEENVASLETLLGESLGLVGDGREAWEHVYGALRVTPKLRDPGNRSTVFMTAANLALRDGMYEAARVFQEEVVRCGRQSDPLRTVEALTWLARIQDRLGQRGPALATLREARSLAERLGDPDQQRAKEADLDMMEGAVIARDDPHRAIALLSSSLAVYGQDNNQIFSLWTLLARARAYRRVGDDARAEADLDGSLALYDQLGQSLEGEQLRLAFLAETDDVFGEMIALQAERDPDLAFAYADRARTRVLPGSASKLWTGDAAGTSRLLAAEPQPLGLDEIRRGLPADSILLQFYVLPDRVLIWRRQRDAAGESFSEQPILQRDLIAHAAELRRLGRPGAGAGSTAPDDLFDLLIRPVLRQEDAGRRLVLIPDKVLHRVPFAALRDRASGRFLVEDHALAIAPSATLYVNALALQREPLRTAHARGLVVGDPAVDRVRFATLYSLPEAAVEATRLAALTGAVSLLGETADTSSFLAAARGAEWIHFAGHAVVDPRNTLLSMLVLAPGRDHGSGALTAREIYSLKLPKTRLVMLAACDTGDEYVPGGEGATSLARAFLAAGVPTVIASLWDIGDRPAARLSDLFHQHLLAGNDPVEALRQAQLSMLHGSDKAGRSPAAWGAFEVFGASAH